MYRYMLIILLFTTRMEWRHLQTFVQHKCAFVKGYLFIMGYSVLSAYIL